MASKLRAWAAAVRAPARMKALLRPEPEPVVRELSIVPGSPASAGKPEKSRRLTRQSRDSIRDAVVRRASMARRVMEGTGPKRDRWSREAWRRRVTSVYWQLMILGVAMIDIVFMIVDTTDHGVDGTATVVGTSVVVALSLAPRGRAAWRGAIRGGRVAARATVYI